MDSQFATEYDEAVPIGHWWFAGRQRLVNEAFARFGLPSGLWIDVGSGAASMLPEGLQVLRCDLRQPTGSDGRPFVLADAANLPFPSQAFAGAALFDVIEHSPHPQALLSEAKRVTRRGGWTLVTVPAHTLLWSKHDQLVGHHARYSLASLERLLAASGWLTVWSSHFYGFLTPAALVRKLARPSRRFTTPPPAVNRWLTRLATASGSLAMARRQRVGLSLVGLARRP